LVVEVEGVSVESEEPEGCVGGVEDSVGGAVGEEAGGAGRGDVSMDAGRGGVAWHGLPGRRGLYGISGQSKRTPGPKAAAETNAKTYKA